MENAKENIELLNSLKEMGINISIDDFGTGYSSLSYLHKLPLHTIKIDQSFVTNINEHPENQAIVDATVAMAEHMGKNCIIEGIETIEDLEYFQGIAINAMQGYFFSHPVPEQRFLELLNEGSIFDFKEINNLDEEELQTLKSGTL
jgi:EAL domain-containing protein (putative c-di-GMP-specific phosphodiesterase class I)